MMGSGEWGMGNGEWGMGSTSISPFPTPYSLLPLYLSFEISSKYLTNILTPPAAWPQS
jgi:hypothetical protein